jgi:hypothetical protein
MSPEYHFKDSEHLLGSVKFTLITEKVFVSKKPIPIALIELQLNYQCDKFLAKCIEDFDIELDIKGEPVHLAIKVLEAGGKLGHSPITTNVEKVGVKISRGRGEGFLKIVYEISVKSSVEGTYSYTATIYLTTKGMKKRLGEPFTFAIRVVKPIEAMVIDVVSKNPIYYLGDSLSLSIGIRSNYRGTATITISGATGDLSEEIELREGTQEILKELTLRQINPNYINVSLKIPEINFEVSNQLQLNISPTKIAVEIIEVPQNVFIGEKTRLKIKIKNGSLISQSDLEIWAKIYEHKIEKRFSIKPQETVILEIPTPMITQRSLEELSGFIKIVDKDTGYTWSQELRFETPQPPVFINIESREYKIFTSMKQRVTLRIENMLGSGIEVLFSTLNPTICKVHVEPERIVLKPFEFKEIALEIEPKTIGEEVLKINSIIVVNGVKVYEQIEELRVKVVPSFEVIEYRLLDIKSKEVVKGQKIRVYLKFKALSESDIEVKVSGKNLKLYEDKFILIPPIFEKQIDFTPTNYEDFMIALSDGVYVHEILLPVKVVEPEVELSVKEEHIYGGLKSSLKIEIENPYDVDLKLSVKVGENEFIRPISRAKELLLKTNTKETIELEVIGLKHAKTAHLDLIINVLPIVEEKVDEHVFTKSFPLDVRHPVTVELTTSNLFSLYLEKSPAYKDLYSPFLITMIVENITDFYIEDLEASFTFNELPSTIASHREKLILEPRGKKTVSIPWEIPFNYLAGSLTLTYKVTINKEYVLIENKLDIPINKYTPLPIEYNAEEFKHESCEYPRIKLKDMVLVMAPINEELNTLVTKCGKPLKTSELHLELVNIIYSVLSTSMSGEARTAWDAVASIVLKHVLQSTDYTWERKTYEDIATNIHEFDIVPAILWKKTLGRLIASSEAINVKVEKAGILIPSSEKRFQALRSEFYVHIMEFILNNSEISRTWLHNYIKASVENLIAEPLYLLYRLNGGNVLDFNSKIFFSLLEKSPASSLIYLALTNSGQWIYNEEVLKKIREILIHKAGSIYSKKSSKTALAMVLMNMHTYLKRKISEVVSAGK